MSMISRVLMVLIPLLVAYVLDRRFNTLWEVVDPITEKRYEMHATRGAYGSRSQEHMPRMYIISGGSGFTGSWIARYLLLRGEKHVHILDRVRPPGDLLKHGAVYTEVNLGDPIGIESVLRRLREKLHPRTHVIVYNCCIVKRYWAPNFLIDLGVAASEAFFVALGVFQSDQVTVIHVGDTLAHRQPIRNFDRLWPTQALWNQETASDTVFGFSGTTTEDDENERDNAFSSYAWHQLTVERIVLQLSKLSKAVKAAGVLRVEGFMSGHAGDGFLEPCVQANWAHLHSPNACVTVVHVEDVARACLSLEHALTDPATQEQFDGKQFTIASDEVTTMKHIFDYLKKKRSRLTVINLQPVLVFIITSIVALFTPLMKIAPTPARRLSRSESLFLGLPYTLTYARFYTLQAGQRPLESNSIRQRDLLGVKNNFSLSQTLDMVCEDVAMMERSQGKEKKKID